MDLEAGVALLPPQKTALTLARSELIEEVLAVEMKSRIVSLGAKLPNRK